MWRGRGRLITLWELHRETFACTLGDPGLHSGGGMYGHHQVRHLPLLSTYYVPGAVDSQTLNFIASLQRGLLYPHPRDEEV